MLLFAPSFAWLWVDRVDYFGGRASFPFSFPSCLRWWCSVGLAFGTYNSTRDCHYFLPRQHLALMYSRGLALIVFSPLLAFLIDFYFIRQPVSASSLLFFSLLYSGIFDAYVFSFRPFLFAQRALVAILAFSAIPFYMAIFARTSYVC